MHSPKYNVNKPRAAAIFTLIFIWTFHLLGGQSLLPSIPGISQTRISQAEIDRISFITASSIIEVPRFHAAPLNEICSSTVWNPDLVLHCSNPQGGLHNVRQQIITCVRFSIAYGAALVLPTPKERVETGTEDVVHEYLEEASDIGYLFDHAAFIDRLRQGCPGLKVYENTKEDQEVLSKLQKLPSPKMGDIQSAPEKYLKDDNVVVGEKGLIDFGRAAGLYEICHDGAAFADAIGQVLVYREDTRRLAAAVLYEMSLRFNLTMEPEPAITESAYLGVHLRTAPDATRGGWLSYEDQSAAYDQYAKQYNLPVIYVASGNLSSIVLFSNLVAPMPVVTKYTLLESRPRELAALKALSWDQQAEVDYLVLLRSSRYLGMTDSNFSWAVAVARRAVGIEGTCGGPAKNGIVGFRAAKGNGDVGVAFEDEKSVIVGRPCRFRFETRAWP